MPRGDLFPDIGPYETGYLPLASDHVMYWEQAGNPRGYPVLFLHGGPGAGAGAVHRRFFDPAFWRIVIFDQRGAGRSRPLGGLENNTTPHLVEDIERLRIHLGVDRWLLFGGSWGSTLALAYAQTHADRVAACVLRGIFLGRASRVHDLLGYFLLGDTFQFQAILRFHGSIPGLGSGPHLLGGGLPGIYFHGGWHHNCYFCRNPAGCGGLVGQAVEFLVQEPGGKEHLRRFGLPVKLLL